MSLDRFTSTITSVADLEAVIGKPSPIAIKKELQALDEHMRRFIGHSPFALIGTYGAGGRCDVSPRGDAPGFCPVIDEHTFLIPDRPGNKRVDSFHNILETGRVGVLFLVPGMGETLRVNGRATIIRDETWLQQMIAQNKRPQVAIAVEVEECFFFFFKAIIRSKLWESHVRPDLNALPCAAEMLVDQTGLTEYDVPTMQSLLDGAYKNNLY